MTATAAPVVSLPASVSAVIDSLHKVQEQLAQHTQGARAAQEQMAHNTRTVSAAIAQQVSALRRAATELKRALNRADRRAQIRTQRELNAALLRSCLSVHVSRRTRTHLGLLLAPCTRTPRADHDQHTHTQRAPLATCQAMNAPGAESLTRYKNAKMRD